MAEQRGKNILGALQKQWRILGIVYCLVLALHASLLLTLLAHRWWQWSLWTGLLILTIFFLIALFLFPYWRITLPDIARFLDSHLPELEESCGLLLKPTKELGPLEKLQVARTEAALTPGRAPRPLQKKLLRPTSLLPCPPPLSPPIAQPYPKNLTP